MTPSLRREKATRPLNGMVGANSERIEAYATVYWSAARRQTTPLFAKGRAVTKFLIVCLLLATPIRVFPLDGMIYSTRPFEPQVLRVWSEEKTSESTHPESTNAHSFFFYAYCPNRDLPMEDCTAIGRYSGYSQEEIEYLMSKLSRQHIISTYFMPAIMILSILLPLKITSLFRSNIVSFNIGLSSALLAESIYLSGQSLSLLSEDLHDSIHYANASGLIKIFRLPYKVPISQFILYLEKELTELDRCHKTARGRRCIPYDKEDFIQ